MIASGKILSPNVTLSQGVRAKGGNQRVHVKASGIQSAVIPRKPLLLLRVLPQVSCHKV